ncbi:MAG: XRE family transcriptional regulator [Burkholderiaceae bacterium]|nr:XRE family transcriptional regulator [Burkholderiaceae bacterium]
MSATEFAPVNPKVLAWARTEGGWRPEQVAKTLNVKPERIVAWERGERNPTFRQVEKLARFFHRPLSVFFQSTPPDLPPLGAEYRRLPGVEVGAESPALRLAIRQMLNRRALALDLLQELGENARMFDLVARFDAGPAAVGTRLRERLGVSIDAQLGWVNEWQAWRAWRGAAEAAGVLVFRFAKVPLEEVRGLSLLHWPLPVVGVNGKERVPEAQVFTLMHELVHLTLVRGHEEQPALLEKRDAAEWSAVERFAEAAASHALVPENALSEAVDQVQALDRARTIVEVQRMARRFRISPLAMATRLRESGFMSWERYHDWRGKWTEFVATLPKRGGGFATPAEKTMGRAGRPFVRLVLEAMETNRITSVDAARFLDLKFQHFDQLRMLLRGPGEGTTGDV